MYLGDEQENLQVRRAKILRAAPVARGNFDKAHLKAIHAFLFEPYTGTRYQPGQFRTEVVGWGKEREESYYRVFYSKMDSVAEKRLEVVLGKMDPEHLRAKLFLRE